MLNFKSSLLIDNNFIEIIEKLDNPNCPTKKTQFNIENPEKCRISIETPIKLYSNKSEINIILSVDKKEQFFDLIKDFEKEIIFSPFPQSLEEFTKYKKIIYLNEKPFTFFICLNLKILKNEISIISIILSKSKICKCGVIDPKLISNNGKLIGCEKCQKL